MKTIIAGSRSITDMAMVARAMVLAEAGGIRPTAVICGCAPGVDLLGKAWAEARCIPVVPMPAAWRATPKRGAAGPIRNRAMAKLGDALVAVWDGHSTGTEDMIAAATAEGLEVRVMRVDATQPDLFSTG